jgi:hypothetical protein
MVEWVTFVLLRPIRESPNSNLFPETGYPDTRFLVVFLSPYLQANAAIIP